jgi:hypothetical protein
MRLRLIAPLAVAVVVMLGVALAIGGCGSDGAAPQGPELEAVSAPDAPAKLPRGWKPVINNPSGFSVGRPAGWKARMKGPATILSAPANLVAVSITADRTREALGADLNDLAERTIHRLPLVSTVQAQPPRPFKHRYRAVVIDARGGQPGRPPSRLRLIVLRPDSIAVFSLLAASSTGLHPGSERKIVEKIARTLRYRPVAVG